MDATMQYCMCHSQIYSRNKSTYSSVQSGSLCDTHFKVDIYRPEFQTTVCSSSKPPTHNNRTIKTLCLWSIHCKQSAVNLWALLRKHNCPCLTLIQQNPLLVGTGYDRKTRHQDVNKSTVLPMTGLGRLIMMTRQQRDSNRRITNAVQNVKLYQNGYVSAILIRLRVSQEF